MFRASAKRTAQLRWVHSGKAQVAEQAKAEPGTSARFVPPVVTAGELGVPLAPGVDAATPVPLPVELAYKAPLKWPVKHRHLTGQITLRLYGKAPLEAYLEFALRAGYYLGIPMTGPRPLPLKVESWTFIRSHFAQAKSKDNWERKTRLRLLQCYDCTEEVFQHLVDTLAKYKPEEVLVKATLYKHELLESAAEALGVEPAAEEEMSEAVKAKVAELLASAEFGGKA